MAGEEDPNKVGRQLDSLRGAEALAGAPQGPARLMSSSYMERNLTPGSEGYRRWLRVATTLTVPAGHQRLGAAIASGNAGIRTGASSPGQPAAARLKAPSLGPIAAVWC